MRNNSVEKTCLVCEAKFKVFFSRKDTAKFCSRDCSNKAPRAHNTVNCRECGINFPQKESQARKRIWGSFCSDVCISKFRSRVTVGSGNSNFRGRNFDHDGYRVYTPKASMGLGLGRIKVHHAVALLAIGEKKVPKGVHVHHRDCNVLNNKAENICFMSSSDHKWIHQQYGVATLGAIMRGEVDPDIACNWSDDPIRAHYLLLSDVNSQAAIVNHFKSKGKKPILTSILSIKPVRCEFTDVDQLTETERGTGGLGSTGA